MPSYTDQDKETALTTLAACRNNYSEAARFCKKHYGLSVSADQITRWAKGIQIKPEIAEKAEDKKRTLAEEFENVVRQALLILPSKLKDTDAKDLMMVAAVGTDKMQLLRGQATEITQRNLSDEEKALRVAELLMRARKRSEGHG